MNRRSDPASARALDRNAFLLLLVVLTVAFAWIIWPFYGAVFWGSVLALLFEPLYARFLRRWKGRRNLAALATLAIILVIVILPLALVAVSLVQEVTGLYQRVKSGQVNFGTYFAQIVAALPSWASGLLERLGLDDLAGLQAKLTAAITQRGEALAGRAVDIGQDVLDLVVGFCIAMYLLFFLLRDGAAVARDIRAAIPLAPAAKARLLERFTTVIRATVKGNVLVAAAQGALGGLAFWVLGVHAPMLWAVVMAFLSLLPAVGAALIWGPVALYLLAIGQVWQGFGADRLRRLRDRPDRQRAAADPGRQGHPAARLRGADLDRRRPGRDRPERLRHRPADRGDVRGGLAAARRRARAAPTAKRATQADRGRRVGPFPTRPALSERSYPVPAALRARASRPRAQSVTA